MIGGHLAGLNGHESPVPDVTPVLPPRLGRGADREPLHQHRRPPGAPGGTGRRLADPVLPLPVLLPRAVRLHRLAPRPGHPGRLPGGRTARADHRIRAGARLRLLHPGALRRQRRQGGLHHQLLALLRRALRLAGAQRDRAAWLLGRAAGRSCGRRHHGRRRPRGRRSPWAPSSRSAAVSAMPRPWSRSAPARGVDMLPACCLAGLVDPGGRRRTWRRVWRSLHHDLAITALARRVPAGAPVHPADTLAPTACRPARSRSYGRLQLVLAPLWVWLLVDEVPATATLIGGAVVAAAVFGHALQGLRAERL